MLYLLASEVVIMSKKKEIKEVQEEKTELKIAENVEAPKVDNEPVELTPFGSDEDSYDVSVETLRQEIFKQNKKSSRLSMISMIIVFALCALGFFFMSNKDLMVFAYVTLGVALVTLIIFSVIIKRGVSPDYKTYIKKSCTLINRYVFNSSELRNCTYDDKAKIEFGEICNDGVYSEIKEAVSRNVVEGSYKGRSFKAAELGIYKAVVKRTKPTAFVGKYLTYPNDLHFVDRIVIVSTGENQVDIPDGINDLEVVSEDKDFKIYAPKGCKIKEVLPTKFISKIKSIDVKDHLWTLTVVLWAGRSVIYASYDDESVTLPLQNKINTSCYSQYKSNLEDELEALNMLLGE